MATVLNELGRTLNRAWEDLVSGWRDLMRGARGALTQYSASGSGGQPESGDSPPAPSWGLLPGEVMETGKSVVVQIELPGVERDDIDVYIDGNSLVVRGEKCADRGYFAESYYLRERAFGWFERVVPLPTNVDTDHARAAYRSGVLTVELPKTGVGSRRRLTVQ